MNTFWDKLSRSLSKKSLKVGGECILWTGSTDRHGYGKKKVKWPEGDQKVERVHRVAYMLNTRLVSLPHSDASGAFLDVSHICHNKLCINPDHLVLETHLANMSRIHCHYSGVCSLEHSPACFF